MKKEQIIRFFFRETQQMKRFLTSKNLFVFLFFLALSTGLWGLHALRKNYETTIQIPIGYENLPLGWTQTEELPDNLTVTVADRGSLLFTYHLRNHFSPIPIDMSHYLEKNESIETQILAPFIQKQLNASTQIIDIKPALLQFNFVQLRKKTLPVKLIHRIGLAQQYTLCDSIEISPQNMEVFAPGNILDTMHFVYTEPVILQNLKDTFQQSVPVQTVKGVTYSHPTVSVTIKTELYTEKMVKVPIFTANVPKHLILRVFPSVVNVNFQLGLSLYDKVDALSFVPEADYNEIEQTNDRKRLPIRMAKQPPQVFNVKINPKEVDYLVEVKE